VGSNRLKIFEDSFDKIPPLSGYSIDAFDIKPLPGYTNLNFHLKNAAHDWVLRIPKRATNQYLDRNAEAHNANIAFDLGLAPNCLWRDANGFSLSDTIQNSRSLAASDFTNTAIVTKLVSSLQQLHCCTSKFHGSVDIEALLTRYYQLMPKPEQSQLAERYHDARAKVKNALQQHQRLVPSHNDLVLENILFDDQRIWIIDWEYASMASPYWDLATLCNAANLNVDQAQRLLDKYQSEESKLELELLMDYRQILAVLSACWMAAFTNDGMTIKC
jgi:thiamine kinase-like enzyme